MAQSNAADLLSGSPVDPFPVSSPADWWAWIWTHISIPLPPIEVLWGVGALAVLLLTFLFGRASLKGLRSLGRLTKAYLSSRSIEDVLTIVAASIATGVSATGMWRFAEDVLHLPFLLRVLLFAFIEVAIVTSAVRARRNMRENFSAGVDGMAVWALTVLTAVLSSMDARSLPEAVFRLAAPLVAAWLWERGMAIERHRIRGTKGIHWRFTLERAMVRLGLAEARDRSAADVDAHRRLTRVALAAKRAKALREAGAPERKLRAAFAKLDKAMDQAVEHTGLSDDETRQSALLARIDALNSTATLARRDKVARWADPTTQEDRERAETALNEVLQFDTAEATQRAIDRTAVTLMALTERATSEQVTNKVTPLVTETVTHVDVPAPRNGTTLTPAVTAPVTPSLTVERVNEDVTFDVTDEAWFDIERALTADPSVTRMLTHPMTPDEVTQEVNDAADEATKTKVMRLYWESEVAKKRHPRPIDLARHAGADRSLASRLLNEWVEELSGWDKRRAKAALRGKASA
ncbi:hypothetical protein ACIBQX_11125 [Nonomuraea sp. NPDC049714]|uniref:hypothetical protein n=1 Tax=Nonomuraea sp. NPDC049714 TaxID=3364357 RepID=UPI0037BA05F6